MAFKFTPKKVSEVDIFTFEFGGILLSGEVITNPVISIVVTSGSDPTPGDLLEGIAGINVADVTQKLKAGTPYTSYAVICEVDTSPNNRHLVLTGDLYIVPDKD